MKVELIDDIVSFFASQGPDAELQINLFLDKYVRTKREREAERQRYLKSCARAERRAEDMRRRGISGAMAIENVVNVPSHEAEVGVAIWTPPGLDREE